MHLFNRIANDVQSAAVQYVSSKAMIGVVLFDMKKSVIGYSRGFYRLAKKIVNKITIVGCGPGSKKYLTRIRPTTSK